MYWGLRSPVTLVDSDIAHYWQHFQPEDAARNNENNENAPPAKAPKVRLNLRINFEIILRYLEICSFEESLKSSLKGFC